MVLKNLILRPKFLSMHKSVILAFFGLFLIGCGQSNKQNSVSEEAKLTDNDTLVVNSEQPPLIKEGENNFKSLTQLTDGGDNAEAYWSFDDSKLVFQVTNPDWGLECDQIYYFDWQKDDLLKEMPHLVSTGKGRTTCSYFMPGDSTIIYASTHLADSACPPVPERKEGKYVWPIYESFDIFIADLEGNIMSQLTNEPGYDAEATVSPKGDKIVFTSMRTGDLELFTCDIDGSNVKQITNELGYDGGAFFSPDGSQVIVRSFRPKTAEEIKEYKDLLAEGLVQPTNMELYICNADGSNLRQLTQLGNANWCPFFHPSGEKEAPPS
jgi:hypothetical protein